jgi:C-terminal processing protease CtpA/Prc
MVALFAREETGAKIVGTATPGKLVSHTGFKIDRGFTLALPVAAFTSWGGTRLDGTGILPDLLVDFSYADAREHGDRQLCNALELCKNL